MESGIDVALSAQLALERRLVTIAHNVANAGTAGFRAEGVDFDAVVSSTRPFLTSFASAGSAFVSRESGAFTKTGNPLDVAIQGSGYMAISTPQGTAYTRDGRMQMLPSGDLVTLNGHAVLDVSGSPITLDPAQGNADITRDGMIRQGGRAVGAIGLFEPDFQNGYARFENSSFLLLKEPEPVEDFTANGFVQGFVEESNVNAVTEITRLISVQRAFEAVSASMEQRDSSLRSAIQALGPRSG